MKTIIALLPGDGIGPEVIATAADILRNIAPLIGLDLDFKEALVGGAAIEKTGVPIPTESLHLARGSKAVLFGAVGEDAWDDLELDHRPEQALLALRKELGLYANLRPVRVCRPLLHASPLKEERIEGADLLIVRELTGGIYFGEPRGLVETKGFKTGFNTMIYHENEVRRIARVAFEAARERRRKVTSVDKANILETSRLWRVIVEEESAAFPDVALDHLYVDNCAMQLVLRPSQFDVLLTSNLFGDILSDEAAVLEGSIGLLPSASLGLLHALYEPVHGSAPDIAGMDKANPIAAILSVALMLRYTFHLHKEACILESAVESTLENGWRTADIADDPKSTVGTARMGALIREEAMARLLELKEVS